MPDDTRASDEYVGEYDKLVRDGIPAVVRDDGNHPVTREVDGREYDRYLAAKLVEEAREYRVAVDDADEVLDELPDEALDELADAYAVLDAVVAASDRSMADVEARAREKADGRGGFSEGIVLERIEPAVQDDPEDPDAGDR